MSESTKVCSVMAAEYLPQLEIPAESKVKEQERVCEIYKIVCNESGKIYVGQTVSHILNNGSYIKFGTRKRFIGHVSEALSKKTKQCRYLNNAIRKYGKDAFSIFVIGSCKMEEGDHYECLAIQNEKALFPMGYNLKMGGKSCAYTLEAKKNLASSVKNLADKARYVKYKNFKLSADVDPKSVIFPLKRRSGQYGWGIRIGKISQNVFELKTDFGGTHQKLDDSYERAILFVKWLQRLS
jgi:hypothetical protein